MSKIKVAIAGTVGKSVSFDPNAGARAEAAVAALAAQISAGVGGNIFHGALRNLQVGDDHPQYTGNAFPETITGLWNFSTIPLIQGDTLAEYIEDVVGGSVFDFLQDTTSVVWTYHETANELEANVPPEFVQDVVGAMLVDTSTVDFTYDDTLGQISAVVPGAALSRVNDTNVTLTLGGTPLTALARAASLTLGWTGQLAVPRGGSGAATLTGYLKGNSTAAFTASATIPYSDISGTPTIPAGANPTASVGLAAVNGVATSFLRSDGAPALSQAITPTWTNTHTFNNTPVVPNNSWTYAKIQDVSATSRVLGRISSGAGDIEELTGANIATILGSAIPSGANPSASVGLSTVNGSAATFMRSDGAPALSQTIAPTMSGKWTFTKNGVADNSAITLDNNINPFVGWRQGGASANQRNWDMGPDSGTFLFRAVDDVISTARNIFEVTHGTGVELGDIRIGNATSNNTTTFLGTGRVTFGGVAKLKNYTVATLPTGAQYDTAMVSDALTPVFGAAVVGGGAVTVPVYYTGAAWFVG